MPTLKLDFPGGRYHATPWGCHVNEGLVEWPPSPWRLLRALLACGFSSQGWSEPPPTARRLIGKLAGVLPKYHLPAASAAHSRHFMPVGVLAKGREKTTLVFDAWADVGDGQMLIQWECELDAEETALLGELASALGYLGRSESWVEAKLVPDPSPKWNATPCVENERRGPGWEQVSLAAAVPPDDYDAWRLRQTESALAAYPLPEGKKKAPPKLVKDREKAVEPYPPDLTSCLTKDTAWWKGRGWSQPPGSRRVVYWRRNDSLQVGVPAASRPAQAEPVTTMLLALSTGSGDRSALPPIERTLPQAELFHRAIVGRAGQGQRIICPELTGKDEFDRPLRNAHAHAHVVPLDLDGDGRLDHVLVHAAMKLGEAAQQAVRTLRRTWTKGGVGELQVALAGSGGLDMLRKLPDPLGMELLKILGPPERAREWVSATPFVLPKTQDRRSRRSVLGQVNAELASRGLPAAESVEVDLELTRKLRHFVRRRGHGGVPPKADAGYGLRLRLAEPVQGPLLLGYGSHYGLGLFHAAAAEIPIPAETLG